MGKLSKESKKKISQALKGRRSNFYGHKHSKETIEKFKKRKGNRKPFEELIKVSSIRRRLIEERGNKCEECGWCEVNKFHDIVPIQLDHIDGDRTNNTRENLKLLCPNCHSLTETFMFFGRKHRMSAGR